MTDYERFSVVAAISMGVGLNLIPLMLLICMIFGEAK